LVVEENAVFRWANAERLRAAGFEVLAVNSAEAEQVLESTAVDALFCAAPLTIAQAVVATATVSTPQDRPSPSKIDLPTENGGPAASVSRFRLSLYEGPTKRDVGWPSTRHMLVSAVNDLLLDNPKTTDPSSIRPHVVD
jgi:hypothetical protein